MTDHRIGKVEDGEEKEKERENEKSEREEKINDKDNKAGLARTKAVKQ